MARSEENRIPHGSKSRIGRLIAWRRILIVAGIAFSAVSWYPATHLKFDRTIESLYSSDDPILRNYLRSREWFGGDEIAFLTYTDPDLDSEESRDLLQRVSREVAAVPGIDPTSVQDYWSAMQGSRIPLVSIPEEELRETIRGVLLGEDDRTTAVVMRFLGESESPVPREVTINRLREIASSLPFESYLVGEPILVQESFRYVEEDGSRLWLYSSLILTGVILILLRDARWTLLPLFVVLFSVLWTRGLIGLTGANLSMVSSVLNSLITIIGTATVIHLALKYRELRSQLAPLESLEETIRELSLPIFWTVATTCVGFLVLTSSSITPVRTFGLMMALGTASVIPAVLCAVPYGALTGSDPEGVVAREQEDWMRLRMSDLTRRIQSYPREIWIGSLIIVSISLSGFLFLRVETDFSKNFRSDTSIVRGLDFVETKLGGTGNWEVNFPAPAELDYEYLGQVRSLSEELEGLKRETELGLTKVIALSDAVDLVPRIPLVSFTLGRRMSILRKMQPDLEKSLYAPGGGRMRIVLRSLERLPSRSKVELMDRVLAISRKYFPDAEVTGLYVILTHLIDSLMFDQWLSFLLAGLGIFGLTTIAFRSLWLGLISLIPNVFPIVLVLGLMGWLGMPINMATAMIASVSMGLTVDSGIHYLSAFQSGRRSGLSFEESLENAQRGVGRALIIANVALVSGFLVLSMSHFIPLVYFGVLVSISMSGGLLGNLVLLPLMMRSGRPEWCDGVGIRGMLD